MACSTGRASLHGVVPVIKVRVSVNEYLQSDIPSIFVLIWWRKIYLTVARCFPNTQFNSRRPDCLTCYINCLNKGSIVYPRETTCWWELIVSRVLLTKQCFSILTHPVAARFTKCLWSPRRNLVKVHFVPDYIVMIQWCPAVVVACASFQPELITIFHIKSAWILPYLDCDLKPVEMGHWSRAVGLATICQISSALMIICSYRIHWEFHINKQTKKLQWHWGKIHTPQIVKRLD